MTTETSSGKEGHAVNPDHPNETLLGTLVRHSGHMLTVNTRYIIPPGKVYGAPHVFVFCETCKILIRDEEIS